MSRFLLPGSIIALLVAAVPAVAENWPQWRGPKNDGLSSETGLPIEWSSEKNVLWKLPLEGRGQSTPCVWGDKIFITTVEGGEVVLSCIGTDGKLKWKDPIGQRSGGKSGRGDEGNEASASCSTDGKHVWTSTGTGRLVCYTLAGKRVWEVDLQRYGKFSIQFGVHWTPVLYKDKLYMQVFHRNAQIIVALDAETGNEVWKVNRPGYGKGESPDTYASAFMWEGPGGPLLVAHGNDYTTAHRLDTGAEVWRVAGLNPTSNGAWRFVSSPLVTPDLIVAPSCKNGPTVGFNPVGAKGKIDEENPAELWRFKSTPDVVSPLRVGDVVYLMSDGPLTALDAKTGKQLYRESLTNGIHRAQMVGADGKVYVLARDGTTDVVEAGRTFKKLASNKLPDTFYGSPAISNGRIYLHGWNNLWAIGKQ